MKWNRTAHRSGAHPRRTTDRFDSVDLHSRADPRGPARHCLRVTNSSRRPGVIKRPTVSSSWKRALPSTHDRSCKPAQRLSTSSILYIRPARRQREKPGRRHRAVSQGEEAQGRSSSRDEEIGARHRLVSTSVAPACSSLEPSERRGADPRPAGSRGPSPTLSRVLEAEVSLQLDEVLPVLHLPRAGHVVASAGGWRAM